ncbi:MAG: SGNH/GDSL hydrolase family protein [Clostridiales bacterium]|jgi:lysophospholipase L1-like esterase|nr:SGNH/GDSL hydrolase family protein [Clostridiales bacterium]
MRVQNPTVKILFMAPIYRSGYTGANGLGKTLPDYTAALKGLAAANEYRVVDNWPAFNAENFAAGGTYTGDGLHPNRAGHQYWADWVYDLENS